MTEWHKISETKPTKPDCYWIAGEGWYHTSYFDGTHFYDDEGDINDGIIWWAEPDNLPEGCLDD